MKRVYNIKAKLSGKKANIYDAMGLYISSYPTEFCVWYYRDGYNFCCLTVRKSMIVDFIQSGARGYNCKLKSLEADEIKIDQAIKLIDPRNAPDIDSVKNLYKASR